MVAALADTSGTPEEVGLWLLSVLLPEAWLATHRAEVLHLLAPRATTPSADVIRRQLATMGAWRGVCEQLPALHPPTPVLTGTDDRIVPPGNSRALVERIPGAWLAQFAGGGHGMLYQYPRQLAATIQACPRGAVRAWAARGRGAPTYRRKLLAGLHLAAPRRVLRQPEIVLSWKRRRARRAQVAHLRVSVVTGSAGQERTRAANRRTVFQLRPVPRVPSMDSIRVLVSGDRPIPFG